MNISEELKQEGQYRELLRTVQGLRKSAGLETTDFVNLSVQTGDEGKRLIQKFEGDLKKVAQIKNISFENFEGEETKIGDLTFVLKIK